MVTKVSFFRKKNRKKRLQKFPGFDRDPGLDPDPGPGFKSRDRSRPRSRFRPDPTPAQKSIPVRDYVQKSTPGLGQRYLTLNVPNYTD